MMYLRLLRTGRQAALQLVVLCEEVEKSRWERVPVYVPGESPRNTRPGQVILDP